MHAQREKVPRLEVSNEFLLFMKICQVLADGRNQVCAFFFVQSQRNQKSESTYEISYLSWRSVCNFVCRRMKCAFLGQSSFAKVWPYIWVVTTLHQADSFISKHGVILEASWLEWLRNKVLNAGIFELEVLKQLYSQLVQTNDSG